MYLGVIDLGGVVDQRLPFHSPTIAASALVAFVGVPMLIGAQLSWRGAASANVWALGAGVVLMGWIVAEMIIIREFSPLQPIYFFTGAGIVTAGYRCRRDSSPSRSDGRL